MFIKQTLRALLLFFIVCLSTQIHAEAVPATFPAQLTIDVKQAPTPMIADGKYYLVYEMYLTNYLSDPSTLSSLTVGSNGMGYKTYTFAGQDLAKLIHPIGSKNPDPNPLVFKPGISKMVFMWLAFDKQADIPDKLIHKVELMAHFKGKDQIFTTTTDPMTIKKTQPVIIHAPLHGENWLAGNGPSNTSGHRKADLVVNGQVYFAQRYAIDFIQIGADGKSYQGAEHDNKSYHCYGKEALAVADGKVIFVHDGVQQNVPRSDKLAIDLSLENLPGNYVIIDIGNGKYAGYAHLIPGSITVKFGDNVKHGQVIGKIGNSGNSSEPHLHFQVIDRDSFIGANGIPYAFNRFAVRPVKITNNDFDHIEFISDKWQPIKNQLVLENAFMKFE